MDESKEYLNEKAFSGALAQDAQKYRAEKLDAYALNQDSFNDTSVIDRQMPANIPVDENGIPVPPPLPPGGLLGASVNDGGALW